MRQDVVYPGLALNCYAVGSLSSCLFLSSAGMEGVYYHVWQSSFSSVRLKHMNHMLLPSWGGSLEARMLLRKAGIRATW